MDGALDLQRLARGRRAFAAAGDRLTIVAIDDVEREFAQPDFLARTDELPLPGFDHLAGDHGAVEANALDEPALGVANELGMHARNERALEADLIGGLAADQNYVITDGQGRFAVVELIVN